MLAGFDPQLAGAFDAAFADLFERRETGPLISFGEQVLAPFGGRLFDGYRAEAKAEDRITRPPSVGAGLSTPAPAPPAPA